MIALRQSTASQEIPLGQFIDTAGVGTTPSIANTDIKIWKTGATSLVSKNSGGATVMSNSVQQCTLDATDTNTAGPMIVYTFVSGSLPTKQDCVVYPTAVYDALFAGGLVPAVASVSGAVGSVTGAVGSVTGAVGSVTGAVGSVAGAVGSVGANGVTASSMAADAITEIAAGVKAAAVADPFEANIKEVNGVVVTGTGVLGDEWEP